MRGAFLDSLTLGKDDLDFSSLASTLPSWDFYPSTTASELVERLQGIDIAVTNKVPFSRETLKNAPDLKCICVAATGYDQIDIEAAKAQKIVVCNVVGYSTPSVVQHTIGLIINLASRTLDYQHLVQEGAWVRSPLFCLQDYPMVELENKILGIVGYGRIGQGVANVASALGMIVKTTKEQPLAELLPEVDFLSLHCPLNEKTKAMINEMTLSKMKKGAFIINTSRGGLIDELALANALQAGHLGGAALDVLSKEPPLANNPLLKPLPNLILTPHIAWSTREARQRLVDGITRNVQAYLLGNPTHVVS